MYCIVTLTWSISTSTQKYFQLVGSTVAVAADAAQLFFEFNCILPFPYAQLICATRFYTNRALVSAARALYYCAVINKRFKGDMHTTM